MFGSRRRAPHCLATRSREKKSALYRDRRYKTFVMTKGSFVDRSDLAITNASKTLCHTQLRRKQTLPQDSLFRNNIFESTCQKVDRNEARASSHHALPYEQKGVLSLFRPYE